MITRRSLLQAGAASAVAVAARSTRAFAANAPGVTDKEIKLGQTMAYSGPASAYGVIGRSQVAYFKMVNDQGGINGRMINLISLDDGYSPPKTVEQTRRLVEQEQVALIFDGLGTPCASAVREYLNENKVPQLFVASGAAKFGDVKDFPWTMGWQPNYQTEGSVFAKNILATKPDAKVGVLYQNDDFGKDYLIGMKAGFGDKYAAMVVKEASYEVSEPTIDSQVISLQAAGANTFLIAATPKFAAQAIRKSYDMGWKPLQYLSHVSVSVSSVMKPAGLEKSTGILSAGYEKDPNDVRWKDDPGMQWWFGFMKKYMPSDSTADVFIVFGCDVAATMAQVLRQCGNDLSRENIMRQAASLHDFSPPNLIPGIKVNTSPDNFYPIRQLQLARFNGQTWEGFGDIISS
jgi:branched-chain amino acid transport system substrate-binding protein